MTQSLYQDHFGIRENPFSIIPDPHYLYMSARHKEALAHLLYGVGESGGFVLLTGEVGTGKTTICRALIEQLPENVDLALILNPRLSETELMAALCDELRIAYPRGTKSMKSFFDYINRRLLTAHAKGRNPVLMIDEAQNLSAEGLELVRLLTNLETKDKKLLQIILVGQPELAHILAKSEHRQTAQRITARYHLDALGLLETRNYIHHRLSVAGLDEGVFPANAVKCVHKAARGIPRLINSICDRALLGAYVEGRKTVTPKLAKRAAAEVLGENAARRLNTPLKAWGGLAGALAITAILFWGGLHPSAEGMRQWVRGAIEPARIDTPMASEPAFSANATPSPVERTATPQAPKAAKPASATPDDRPDTNDRAQTGQSTPAPATDGTDISDPTGTVLADMIDSATPDRAFEALFQRWDMTYLKLKGLTPCDKAEGQGLNCRRGETDLVGLKAMNRPAVVSMVMPDGEHVYGVVTRIEDTSTQDTPIEDTGGEGETAQTQITLNVAGRDMTLNQEAFALRWPGDYLVLWKPPAQIDRTLVFGYEGEDVRELRRLLALAGHADNADDASGQGSVFFGPSLRESVRAFQQSENLGVDGIVGPETLLRITGRAGQTAIDTLEASRPADAGAAAEAAEDVAASSGPSSTNSPSAGE